ncbi:MAG TPA: ribosomal protein S18-alanine N-acetyltransferase [Vicinamibacterales bacterium]|jgi:ribosomal-protein-alanine N-acetyltransferase|nr:ribosomal protein S18-alanine N-acetyltransferase [Vicinamibacterales bacterium]
MSWAIGPLVSQDEIDEILAVEHEAFTNPWTREMYLAECDNPEVSYFLLARDASGRLVGFCTFWRILDELHINNLAVLAEFRRQGVASALLDRVLGDGRAFGALHATLEVRESNIPALRLYERCGFRVAGVRRQYYTKPDEDALILWRDELGREPS